MTLSSFVEHSIGEHLQKLCKVFELQAEQRIRRYPSPYSEEIESFEAMIVIPSEICLKYRDGQYPDDLDGLTGAVFLKEYASYIAQMASGQEVDFRTLLARKLDSKSTESYDDMTPPQIASLLDLWHEMLRIREGLGGRREVTHVQFDPELNGPEMLVKKGVDEMNDMISRYNAFSKERNSHRE